MAIYDERLENHPIWASQAAALEVLDATRDKLADPEQVEVHAHIEAVLTKAGVGGAEVACVGRDVPPSLSCWRIEESELPSSGRPLAGAFIAWPVEQIEDAKLARNDDRRRSRFGLLVLLLRRRFTGVGTS